MTLLWGRPMFGWKCLGVSLAHPQCVSDGGCRFCLSGATFVRSVLLDPDRPSPCRLVFVALVEINFVLALRTFATVFEFQRRQGLNREQWLGRGRRVDRHNLRRWGCVGQVQRRAVGHDRQEGEHCARQDSPCEFHLKQSGQQKEARIIGHPRPQMHTAICGRKPRFRARSVLQGVRWGTPLRTFDTPLTPSHRQNARPPHASPPAAHSPPTHTAPTPPVAASS